MRLCLVPAATSEPIPLGLLAGGNHFDDVQGNRRGVTIERNRANNGITMTRTIMLQHVINQDIHRAQPTKKN